LKALMWLRKRAGKLTGNSRGFSSVIGTIFMVLMVMTSIAGVFLSTLYQNKLYNDAVKGQNQQELDARNENVVAKGNYSVSTTTHVVTVGPANLTNAGPVAAQIVNVWVFDTSKQTYGFNNSVANKPWANLTWTTLKAGQVLKFTSNNATKVTVPNATQGDSFNIWFVTARGNTVPLTKSQSTTVINAQTAQGIGALAFDFNSFRYYTYQNSTKLANYPSGNPTYRVPYGSTIAFGFNITNYSPTTETIIFNVASMMWSYFPASPGQANGPIWYIANVQSDGTVSSGYSPISLGWGQTRFLVFAHQTSGQSGDWAVQQKNSLGAINLIFYGNYSSGKKYAQNIPFAAIYAYG